MPGPDIDAEMLLLSARLWARLGVDDLVRLEINTLGTGDSRREHRAVLQQYFRENLHALDDDSRNRLEKNPLRILDSKNPDLDALIKNAPPMDQYLDDESSAHFDRICSVLSAADVAFTINPRLVRGLDYYCKTVFEWKTDQLGAQGTVCAGGRYDGLVELMGGRSTPAVGFALGLERLVELRRIAGGPFEPRRADVYVISTHEEFTADALLLSEDLRSQLEGRVVVCHCGGGSLKSQMKKADRSQAAVAILIGEEEHRSNTVAIKPLRSDEAQRSADIGDCAAAVRPYLS
jgi:histidyl-tRNA synthetase